ERIYSLADFQFTILDNNFVQSPRQSGQLVGVKAKVHTGIPPKITRLTVYNISANGNIQPYISDIHTGFDFIFVPILRLLGDAQDLIFIMFDIGVHYEIDIAFVQLEVKANICLVDIGPGYIVPYPTIPVWPNQACKGI